MAAPGRRAPPRAPEQPPAKPNAGGAAVAWIKLGVTGTFEVHAVRHVIGRAGLAQCLSAGRREVVTVDLFVQSAGAISIAQPSPSNNEGDKRVAACVAGRIKAPVPPNWNRRVRRGVVLIAAAHHSCEPVTGQPGSR